MKNRGYTLIELLIVIAIMLIMATLAFNIVAGNRSGSTLSWGFNGVTETRCIGGYLFVVSNDGSTRQVLDEFGKGARCQ